MHIWRVIRTLYFRELTQLLRDRHTLIYSVAIPIFLYPTLLFSVFQLMAVVKAGAGVGQPLQVIGAHVVADAEVAKTQIAEVMEQVLPGKEHEVTVD